MSFFGYVRMEITRLLRTPMLWLLAALTCCAPLLGLTPLFDTGSATRAAQYLAEPVLAGTMLSMALWGLFTLHTLDRAHKAGVSVLADAVASPVMLSAAKVVALLGLALLSGLLCATVHLPLTIWRLGIAFDLGDYLSLQFVFITGGMLIGILMCAVFYQLTRRVDLSCIAFAACVFLSTSQFFSDNYILRFASPILPTLSDDFSNAWPLRLAAYNRLFWLVLLGGLYLISLLCVRRYGRGLIGSAARNLRRGVPATILAVALGVSAALAYAHQPYTNHASGDVWMDDCEINENAYLLDTFVQSTPDIRTGRQQGTAVYHIENHNTAPYEQLLRINCGYGIQSLRVNGQETPVRDLDDDILWGKHFSFDMPPERDIEVVVEYGGMARLLPGSAGSMFIGAAEIERRYVDLSAEGFAPIMELEPMPGSEHTITAEVVLPGEMTAIVFGGEAECLAENADGTKLWRLTRGRDRMSFTAADYMCQSVPLRDKTFEFYYSRKHEDVLLRNNVAEVLQETLLYGLDNIGTPGWFEGVASLKLVQETALSPGGGATTGISTMYEDTFSEDALNDPDKGAGPMEVMAHEILHQWWGLGRMMTDMIAPEMEPGWTAEGLTVYSTYRLMKEKYGAAYAKEHYVDHWQAEVDAQARDFYNRHPEYLDILPEQYASAIKNGAWGVQRYCEMPLRILKAEALVGGEAAMDAILQDLLVTEDLEFPPYLSYQDFLDACGLSREDVAL